ncbi:hypothetical protein KFK09_020642 [Dendrobium nobile]|uniref:Uncharacterized protein n=1 Tax=Dendrobium nobile TaxID=94219 RepID=A0A8T3AN06_DENNO|nr:hypothetical protein KFK09_020642 [Dendrobium nobile]
MIRRSVKLANKRLSTESKQKITAAIPKFYKVNTFSRINKREVYLLVKRGYLARTQLRKDRSIKKAICRYIHNRKSAAGIKIVQ